MTQPTGKPDIAPTVEIAMPSGTVLQVELSEEERRKVMRVVEDALTRAVRISQKLKVVAVDAGGLK